MQEVGWGGWNIKKTKLPTLLGGLPLRDQQQTKPDLISSLLVTRGVKCDADQHSSRLVLKPLVCPMQSSFMACHHQCNKDTANRRGLKASHQTRGGPAGCLTDCWQDLSSSKQREQHSLYSYPPDKTSVFSSSVHL